MRLSRNETSSTQCKPSSIYRTNAVWFIKGQYESKRETAFRSNNRKKKLRTYFTAFMRKCVVRLCMAASLSVSLLSLLKVRQTRGTQRSCAIISLSFSVASMPFLEPPASRVWSAVDTTVLAEILLMKLCASPLWPSSVTI